MTSAPIGRLVLVLLALLPTGDAGAQEGFDDADMEAARRHFALGSQHYVSSDYAAALREFEAAKKVRAAPQLDYNIGRCLDRLERYPEEIAAYRRYVTSQPRPSDADQVGERIRVLEQRAELPSSPARTAPPVVEVVPPPTVAAGVYDGGDKITLFVDGVAMPANTLGNNATAYMTSHETVMGNFSNAFINEARVSNVVRYTGNFTPETVHTSDSSTVALYHFDEGGGSTATDSATSFSAAPMTIAGPAVLTTNAPCP